MFFEETRIRTVREMILAEDEQTRRAALAKLLPMQRADFVELFEIMKGLPVTIRLLDPPLHEFLPHTQAEIEEVARAMNTDPRRLADRARELAEFNPMLGFRGCRLAIAYPEIAEMQSRAIFEAAVEAGKRTGKAVGLEVMVPLIATKAEFDLDRDRLSRDRRDAVARDLRSRRGSGKADRQGGRARGDGPADRDQGRVRSDQGANRRHRAIGDEGDRSQTELSGRHHDRAAARLPDGWRDRNHRGVLFVRHQRPDANHLRHQPR